MHSLLVVIFCGSLLILFYTYAGYPALISILASIKKRQVDQADDLFSVSLIISVYNEEKAIRDKIENALSQDYPKEKLEIVVASDNSSDSTHEIVKEYEDRGIKLYIQADRLGKTAALNMVVQRTSGQIIVFTDANSMYDSKAIRMMVRNFADPNVGCVTGETRLLNPEGSAIGENERGYYSYDTFLKVKETAVGSTVGADGAIFAIRRELYQPLDPSLINDLVVPLQIVVMGYRVIYEPKAFLKEATATPLKGGFSRRVRIINRALFGVFSIPQVLNPFRVGFFSIQLISRKLLRWAAPLFIILFFISNLGLLASPIYKVIFFLQISFYLLAVLSIFVKDKISNHYLIFPYYFCQANAAALIAIIKFLRGEHIIVWQPLRR